MEDSAAVYKGYVFMADNGGNLMCLNLNTLELVWVQDTLDDSNSTPVLEIENGHLYLYVSTSFRLGWRSNDSATIPIWKIDAETGEIICSRIANGESCAIVTDAGMPAISDPGQDLVALCHEMGITVESVPGPTAFATALAISGMDSGRFTFEGFCLLYTSPSPRD